jgi:wyosine [tRNA(Phe)-imidazoG37] synthetase (radical SAM superfamily)
MRYIYGPIKSRRIGLSLGISVTPFKVCSFDCVYCQLGSYADTTVERKEYIPVQEIIKELQEWLAQHPERARELTYITFSGTGEPTLHAKLGELISEIKKITKTPVAVITNASLLPAPAVRRALKGADLLVPSLDAVDQEVFEAIDRPNKAVDLEEVIEGLVALRKEFKKQIWLEVMLVKGVNDGLDHITRLHAVIERIRPDKIQLNSPVRTPAECEVLPVDEKRFAEIKAILGATCEIV